MLLELKSYWRRSYKVIIVVHQLLFTLESSQCLQEDAVNIVCPDSVIAKMIPNQFPSNRQRLGVQFLFWIGVLLGLVRRLRPLERPGVQPGLQRDVMEHAARLNDPCTLLWRVLQIALGSIQAPELGLQGTEGAVHDFMGGYDGHVVAIFRRGLWTADRSHQPFM